MELDLGARRARLTARLDRLAEVVEVIEKMERSGSSSGVGGGGGSGQGKTILANPVRLAKALSLRAKSTLRALRLLRRDPKGRRAFWATFISDVAGTAAAFAAVVCLLHGLLGLLVVWPPKENRGAHLCPPLANEARVWAWASSSPSASSPSSPSSSPPSSSSSFLSSSSSILLSSVGSAASMLVRPKALCWAWQDLGAIEHALLAILLLLFLAAVAHALSENARLAAGVVASPSDRAKVKGWLGTVAAAD